MNVLIATVEESMRETPLGRLRAPWWGFRGAVVTAGRASLFAALGCLRGILLRESIVRKQRSRSVDDVKVVFGSHGLGEGECRRARRSLVTT
jgi:hypothetical protein